ncbi:hypothetical protein CLPU_6c01320 [Gottschalkia purinilytica]|uniref:Uncharacterized protein Clospo-01618-like domain-containing protein n=1 Tax=Gottschalkia purinilytica TaxID=1503 RepID=A0A0L0WAW7_GOTPU|nr:hypothetical protein [Gottschalkia purinilytica]KNF08646.1 hypothetical protein CLPU_6c01320 [Gottschalkia purinilytica]
MKKIIVFIIPIVILIFIGLAYNYLNRNEERIEIKSLSNIEIYKFNSYTKFSNDKIDEIDDEQKLLKFKMIMNSLDTSDGIKKIEYPEDINIESFEYYAHIKPNFSYIDEKEEVYEDGTFLLFICIGDSEGKSYINFMGSELIYILGESNTKILKEIFSDAKY